MIRTDLYIGVDYQTPLTVNGPVAKVSALNRQQRTITDSSSWTLSICLEEYVVLGQHFGLLELVHVSWHDVVSPANVQFRGSVA